MRILNSLGDLRDDEGYSEDEEEDYGVQPEHPPKGSLLEVGDKIVTDYTLCVELFMYLNREQIPQSGGY